MKRMLLGLVTLASVVLAGCGGGGGASSPPDPGDTAPPVISSIAATPSSTGAVVTWQTNEPTTGEVFYGLTTSYGSRSAPGGNSTTHSVTLSALSAGTIYHYQVRTADAAGNATTSADRTFTTSTVQQTVSFDASIVRPDRSYSLSFPYQGGAYYHAGTSPDWTTTVTFFGRAYSTSSFDPYIAIKMADFLVIPASYSLTQGGENCVQLAIYVSRSDVKDIYMSKSGTVTVSQVGGSGCNWKGSYDAEFYCASTGKALHASGSFDLPHTTTPPPVTL